MRKESMWRSDEAENPQFSLGKIDRKINRWLNTKFTFIPQKNNIKKRERGWMYYYGM